MRPFDRGGCKFSLAVDRGDLQLLRSVHQVEACGHELHDAQQLVGRGQPDPCGGGITGGVMDGVARFDAEREEFLRQRDRGDADNIAGDFVQQVLKVRADSLVHGTSVRCSRCCAC